MDFTPVAPCLPVNVTGEFLKGHRRQLQPAEIAQGVVSFSPIIFPIFPLLRDFLRKRGARCRCGRWRGSVVPVSGNSRRWSGWCPNGIRPVCSARRRRCRARLRWRRRNSSHARFPRLGPTLGRPPGIVVALGQGVFPPRITPRDEDYPLGRAGAVKTARRTDGASSVRSGTSVARGNKNLAKLR